ncbi:hypothetical protein GGQ80_002073 [Sphingomonas jinjuensis]|uniref:Uncharacterized protein n=1 Tax=Sphingomonas jinjuensis TaxID=535907 RepID=A0A840F4C3_9SPHN|nr:hypothetical protein [Sphingomonas jinjuensis]MBB4154163.1 hypothetical protein [Sphingomonas jinjuensis]
MMHQPIDMACTRWCILRMSGPRTLAVADSLAAVGVEAWTPRRTEKRPHPSRKAIGPDGRRATVEIDAPILPTYVFIRAVHRDEVLAIAADPASPHPQFSFLRRADNSIPEVRGADVAGLQEEERRAQEIIDKLRECEGREARRRERAALMKTERARQKALRMERREFSPQQTVTVEGMPALGGMTGIVESSDGRSAVVHFGGSLTMTIEAWRLAPDHVQSGNTSVVAAA